MYICLECGSVFDEPYVIYETHTELDEQPKETFYVCPHCKEPAYEETENCILCDKYIGKSQAQFHLCPDCEMEAEKRFKKILAENFTKDEIKYLNNQYDGEYF